MIFFHAYLKFFYIYKYYQISYQMFTNFHVAVILCFGLTVKICRLRQCVCGVDPKVDTQIQN